MPFKPELRTPFADLADHLVEASKGREVVYIPNPGNFGDGLIRHGTKLLFSDYGIEHYELNIGYSRIRYQLFPLLAKQNRYHFVYGGGGAWSPNYAFGDRIAKLIARRTPRLTVLPSTFGLENPPKIGTLFRRDQQKSKDTAPNSIFCHDMALYTAAREQADQYLYPAPTKALGIMMRTDHESRFSGTVIRDLPKNEDISLEGDHMSPGSQFLMRVADYETIYTDRLHIAIAASLVGRKVKLLTGNYFKIKAIYEATLAPHFSDLVELLPDDFTIENVAEHAAVV